jgi:hypothetical protein
MGTDRCSTCGNLSGHDPIGAAECALLAAHRAVLGGLVAADDRPLRRELLDLYAHLRGVFPAPDAYRATRYVLELGWRPWVRSDAVQPPTA